MTSFANASVIIRAADLSKNYIIDGQNIEILKGIDLTVNAGETVAIIGPSGAGKSTLLHLLGLLETPTSGSLFFQGLDTIKLTDNQRTALRRLQIGFVFQFHHLLTEFSAVENVMLPGLMRGLSSDNARIQAVHLLSQVGLGQRLEHKPGELSGGEQQRVAFARALMNDPKVIMADEPTGNLDRKSSDMLRDMLWNTCHERGTVLLLVTHDESFSSGADRILKMIDGRIEQI